MSFSLPANVADVKSFGIHPASTIKDLATAIKDIFHADNDIQIIGTRHGEKLYETLLTKEEHMVAEDEGNFFRVPVDKRDLYYDKYFVEGQQQLSNGEEYTSHNTTRLSVDQVRSQICTQAQRSF